MSAADRQKWDSKYADAGSYPTPEQWAQKAVPFLLALGPKDNGKSLTAPE